MIKTQSVSATMETTSMKVDVTGAPGGAGVPVAISLASSSVMLTNTSNGAGLEYKAGSGAWMKLNPSDGVELPIDLAVTALLFRRARYDGGLVSALLMIDGRQVLTSSEGALPISAGGAVYATLTGVFAPGGTVTAKLPDNVIGTLQITRKMTSAPFTKSPIADAVGIGVNSLNYVVKDIDNAYTLGVDTSDTSSSTTGGTVGILPLVTNTVPRVWQLNVSSSSARSVYNGNSLDLIPAGATDAVATCQVVTDTRGRLTAIYPVFANPSFTVTRRITGFSAVSPAAMTADRRYDDLFAAAPVDDTVYDVPVALPGATSPGLLAGKRYPIVSKQRTDFPDRRPLLAMRERTLIPVVDGNYPAPYVLRSGADWGVEPDILFAVSVNGDKLNSPLGVNPSVAANSSIIGFIAEYDRDATSAAVFGSSLAKSDLVELANKKGFGWIGLSTSAASTLDRPIEFVNAGQAGQQLIKARICATNAIPTLKPTHVMIEITNPNDISTVSAGTLGTLLTESNLIRDIAAENGARIMYWNGMSRNVAAAPSTASIYPLAQDNLRKAFIAEQALRYPTLDTNSVSNTGTSPDAIQMIGNGFPADFTTTADGAVHQSKALQDQVWVPRATAFWVAEIVNKYWT